MKQQQGQPLLTPASVALSLSPPRVPPHGTLWRSLYTHPAATRRHFARNRHDAQLSLLEHHGESDGSDGYQSHTLPSRMLQLLYGGSLRRGRLPSLSSHPHLPTSLSIPDTLTRLLGTVLPLESQHSFRDGGGFKRVADGMVKLTCPMLGVGHWSQAREFLELTYAPSASPPAIDVERRRGRRWTRRKISYGPHPMQHFDLFLPSTSKNSTANNGSRHDNQSADYRTPVRGTVFFVHGGAWGSGQPWMYRLVAPSFLKLGFAVVIAGYRTYPDAPTIDEQCRDVRSVWDECGHILNDLVVPIQEGIAREDGGWVGNVVMGHSSGAHVALLMLVDLIAEQLKGSSSKRRNDRNVYPWGPDFFVGLSGPYDISYHFDYEAGRGVDQISPMKPICGHSRDNFHKANPVRRLRALLAKQREEMGAVSQTIHQLFPPVLLVHGTEDATVPFTATSDAGRMMRSCGLENCDEVYLEETGHQDVIMHFMLGGQAKDLVMEWLFRCGRQKESAQLRSRL